MEAIRAGLPALDPLGRRAVELACFGGLSAPVIAGFVDQPEERVRTAMRSALLELGALVRPGAADRH